MPHALLGPARPRSRQPQTRAWLLRAKRVLPKGAPCWLDEGPVGGCRAGRPWSLGVHLPDHTPAASAGGAQPGEPTRPGAAGRLCRRKRRCGPQASAGPRSPRTRPPSWGTAPRPGREAHWALFTPWRCPGRGGPPRTAPSPTRTRSGPEEHTVVGRGRGVGAVEPPRSISKPELRGGGTRRPGSAAQRVRPCGRLWGAPRAAALTLRLTMGTPVRSARRTTL